MRPGGLPLGAIAQPKAPKTPFHASGVAQPQNNCPKPRITTGTEVKTKICAIRRSCAGVWIRALKPAKKPKKGKKLNKPKKASVGRKAKQPISTSQPDKIASTQFKGRWIIFL